MGNCTTPSLFLGGTVSTSRQLTILDYQNITLDGTIFILYNTNITCECTFVTFSGSLIFFFFFSHLIVSSLHCVVSTSHATILLSYSVVLFFFFFFSHLMVSSSHSAIPKSHMTVLLSHLVVPLFFFSHLRYHPYNVQYQHHM